MKPKMGKGPAEGREQFRLKDLPEGAQNEFLCPSAHGDFPCEVLNTPKQTLLEISVMCSVYYQPKMNY